MSDPRTIKRALDLYRKDVGLQTSILTNLCENNEMRLQALKSVGFYPQNLVIK